MIKATLKEGKITLSFPYDVALVANMHRLPATWNKRTKEWELPATKGAYEALKRVMNLTIPVMEERLKPKTIDLGKYTPKTKPMAHQTEAVEFVLRQFGFIPEGGSNG